MYDALYTKYQFIVIRPPPPHPPPQKDSYKGRSHMRPRMDFHLVLHGEYL